MSVFKGCNMLLNVVLTITIWEECYWNPHFRDSKRGHREMELIKSEQSSTWQCEALRSGSLTWSPLWSLFHQVHPEEDVVTTYTLVLQESFCQFPDSLTILQFFSLFILIAEYSLVFFLQSFNDQQSLHYCRKSPICKILKLKECIPPLPL